jgi:hypothetical protein
MQATIEASVIQFYPDTREIAARNMPRRRQQSAAWLTASRSRQIHQAGAALL